MNDYLEQLRAQPLFQELMKGIREERPVVPAYSYTDDNTEEWKALSNIQRGFDKCLILLGEKIDE
jgi:hypothetical protein